VREQVKLPESNQRTLNSHFRPAFEAGLFLYPTRIVFKKVQNIFCFVLKRKNQCVIMSSLKKSQDASSNTRVFLFREGGAD
jgi:hypothetical protein